MVAVVDDSLVAAQPLYYPRHPKLTLDLLSLALVIWVYLCSIFGDPDERRLAHTVVLDLEGRILVNLDIDARGTAVKSHCGHVSHVQAILVLGSCLFAR